MKMAPPLNGRLEAFDNSNAAYDRLFADYYDQITGHKNYHGEAKALSAFLMERSHGSCRRLLDIGCGTGGHAILLANMGIDVTAVDLSPDMIRVAAAKASNVRFACGDIADMGIGDDDFDGAYSLFNVVNCLPGLDALERFFAAVAARVRAGGLFFIETWNPIAVIAVPPEVVERTFTGNQETVVRKVTPMSDFLRQRLDLRYDIACFDATSGGRLNQFSVVHKLVLFTPLEIEHALRAAGFEQVEVFTALPHLLPAGDSDRMLAFAARRSG